MDNRYQILFEPVKIGPVTAPNRFYQVPHCNGMGHRYPRALAKMREIKAEGGWGVVCTEEVEIHPTSDITPFNEGRLWDDSDIPGLALMTEAVHKHGSLAGIELVYQGVVSTNHYSRLTTLGPSHAAVANGPSQVRAMSKRDIANVRRWHRESAIRARQAGFDIVYVYAGHDLSVLMHFLTRRHNDRTDEYGGSIENRTRLFKEIIEDTKEAVGDRCAVVVRLAVDELAGELGISADEEGYEIVQMLAELPDLWDVNISKWDNDSQTSRFAKEGFQEPYTKFVKSLTSKPVVGVGRFTSPDTMVSQIKRGVMDMIGAARPSIADPFLPNKIKQGRTSEIRECIGCNICVSCDNICAPIQCTQNPTMGEEWRRGWHPEVVPAKHADERVLIVGAGPAGLDCAHTLVKRGYEVVMAEAAEKAGGRVLRESGLPGLSEWIRVVDYRMNYLRQSDKCEIYYQSRLTSEQVLEFGFDNVIVATGSSWRDDGRGHDTRQVLPIDHSIQKLTPDDVMADVSIKGRVVVYDTDRFYMGGVIAEKCVESGCRDVVYLSPDPMVSLWTENTLEQHRIQKRLLDIGVKLELNRSLVQGANNILTSECVYTGSQNTHGCDVLILVTERLPNDSIYLEIENSNQLKHLKLIGDAHAPGTIAAAVHAGHMAAMAFGDPLFDEAEFRRDKIAL